MHLWVQTRDGRPAAQWFYGGVGYCGKGVGKPAAMDGGGCECRNCRFALDYFARSFVPEVGHSSIAVLDTNGNEILTCGRYGNQDSPTTGESAGIPLGWPLSVVASDTHAYVADTVNRRVVKVRLRYAAEESAEVSFPPSRGGP